MLPLRVHDVRLFGINFSFDSVAFTLPIAGGWDVYWYGILIATGFLLAVVYAFLNHKKFNLDVDRMTDVVVYTTPLAIICARLYYVLFDGEKITSFADLVGFSGGSGVQGLAIYGGVIGAFVFGLLFCIIRKVKFYDMIDIAAVGFLIGQALGRWGNFFNQEAFGSAIPNQAQWGMLSDTVTTKLGPGITAHPCFFYESMWCISGALLIHFLIVNKRRFSGEVALWYGVWYGFGRFFIEGLRTDSLYINVLERSFRVSQLLSAAVVLLCAILLIINYKMLKTDKIALGYENIFDDVDENTIVNTTFYEGEDTNSEEETVEENNPEEETAEEINSEEETETEETETEEKE